MTHKNLEGWNMPKGGTSIYQVGKRQPIERPKHSADRFYADLLVTRERLGVMA